MYGLGPAELMVFGGCCAVALGIVAAIGGVLFFVLRNQEPREKP